MQENKQQRHEAILEILAAETVSSQQQLREALAPQGFEADQSTVSRDLSELGIFKRRGRYRARPGGSVAEGNLLRRIDTAGEHLIVLRTPVGQAQVVGLAIDRAELPEVVGTVAGDDTVFVAVKGLSEQRRAIHTLQGLLAGGLRSEAVSV